MAISTDRRAPLVFELLLWPFSSLYGSVMGVRNKLYDKQVLRSHRLNIPVLSVGNITSGGTGKTPIVALLAEEFSKRGLDVAIVSRGYGGEERGPKRVPASGDVARAFGDEPAFLASKLPRIPVYVARDRVAGVEAIAKECFSRSPISVHERDCKGLSSSDVATSSAYGSQLVISDDGFQHRRLARDFDVVLLDATQAKWQYRSLPLGRARESFASLSRAQFVFVTKTNLASKEHLAWLRSRIDRERVKFDFKVFEFESTLSGFLALEVFSRNLDRNDTTTAAEKTSPPSIAKLREARVFLISAIGRPEAFEDLVKRSSGSVVVDHVIYRDHHGYTEADLAELEERAEKAAADAIIVTEKDAVKLVNWKPKRIPVFVSQLVSKPVGDLGAFYDTVIEKTARTRR